MAAAVGAAGSAHADHPIDGRGYAQLGAPWTRPEVSFAVEPAQAGETWPANVGKAQCGPGSLPETGLQGEVPLADQTTGRSAQGYRCNLELVGQYAGEGAGIMMAWYDTCAYMTTGYPPSDPEYERKKGTVVVDASNPANPTPTDRLSTPAMVNPWEALKGNDRRGLLATGEGGSFPMFGPGSPGPHFDIYDVSADCRHPKLLASTRLPDAKGHEGDFAPDGRTYYQSTMSAAPQPSVVVIDVEDPRNPRQIGAVANPVGPGIHALEISPDGNRGYFMSQAGPTNPSAFNGLEIFDTSDFQNRRPNPELRLLGKVGWNENILTQIGRLVHIGGHPYVITTDEFGAASTPADACRAGKPPYGFLHVIDVADERNPRVVSTLRLEVNDPANCSKVVPEQNAPFPLMYSSHYCTADDPQNTTAIACSWLSSGTRVFDVRDPLRPREIAYYNGPARSDTARANSPVFEVLLGSRTKDTTASAIRWKRGANGRQELWTMSSLGGVQILRFTNGAYPLGTGTSPAGERTRCVDGGGSVRGTVLGPARIARRRRAQRKVLRSARRRTRSGMDRYCVKGGGSLRIGYPTARVVRSLSRSRRRRIAGRALVVLASSPRFSVAGIRRGTTVRLLRRRLRGERRTKVARNTWFTARGRKARLVFRTDGRSVLEVGIADRRLTVRRAALRRFLRAWPSP